MWKIIEQNNVFFLPLVLLQCTVPNVLLSVLRATRSEAFYFAGNFTKFEGI
jgi:hypothetical protein